MITCNLQLKNFQLKKFSFFSVLLFFSSVSNSFHSIHVFNTLFVFSFLLICSVFLSFSVVSYKFQTNQFPSDSLDPHVIVFSVFSVFFQFFQFFIFSFFSDFFSFFSPLDFHCCCHSMCVFRGCLSHKKSAKVFSRKQLRAASLPMLLPILARPCWSLFGLWTLFTTEELGRRRSELSGPYVIVGVGASVSSPEATTAKVLCLANSYTHS